MPNVESYIRNQSHQRLQEMMRELELAQAIEGKVYASKYMILISQELANRGVRLIEMLENLDNPKPEQKDVYYEVIFLDNSDPHRDTLVSYASTEREARDIVNQYIASCEPGQPGSFIDNYLVKKIVE